MDFDLIRSIIYDSIRFCEILYNEDDVKKSYVECGYDISQQTKLFKNLKKKCSCKMPQQLEGFFRAVPANKYYTFLPYFFMERLYKINSIDCLINCIMDKELFKASYYETYFARKEESEITYNDILDISSTESDIISVTYIISNFDKVASELCELLKHVHNIVDAFFHANVQLQKIKNFQLTLEEEAIYLLSGNRKIAEDVYCISFLHPYGLRDITYSYIHHHNYYVLGIEFSHMAKEEMNKAEMNKKDLKLDLSVIFKILSQTMVLEILDLIKVYEKMSVPDIYNIQKAKYNLSSTNTIYRLISSLETNNIIIKYPTTPETYVLNHELFSTLRIETSKKLIYYEETIKKEE